MLKQILRAFQGTHKEKPGNRAVRQLQIAQRKTADYLNRKTADWSMLQMKIALAVFCLLSAAACVLVTTQSIVSANGPPPAIQTDKHPPLRSGSKILKNSTIKIQQGKNEPDRK